MKSKPMWQPRASLETLRLRALLMQRLRSFFAGHDVLEVETPVLSRAATVDPQIDSFSSRLPGGDERWLQTSPEFAMKRLLAAGSGPIFQIARVFRVDESGRFHNPEFTMLEWYRPGFDHHRLIDECEALLAALGGPASCARLSYRDAFAHYAGIDPFLASLTELETRCAQAIGPLPSIEGADAEPSAARDFLLDLLMSHVVGPQLGRDRPEFLIDFPASQAALAKVRRDVEPPVAERFELFWQGIELANGFHELTDAAEQQRRFEADQARRASRGQPVPPYDPHLIAALEHGLPPCAGVAVGLDRLLMLLLGLPHIGDGLAFDDERA
ncbi:EF-P lysine aminoacylase EpmA [uncultured Nevskia sp.]|uniref:EF-P lysine aminoacylase EpmA n=1 Tax=uncultured Nevskia sp. TaxID=228950 RepID=UPI0025F52574|nr:EF-P lysine aminoacylase EpmA [uncultured Nevskia sp.]